VWLAFRADNSAVQVVPNIKVRTKVQQHSILPLSLHDLLWGSFTFFFHVILMTSSFIMKQNTPDERSFGLSKGFFLRSYDRAS
jgi:hypothetical protein